MAKQVSISGAWLRIINGKAQMLLEIDGEWRLVCEEVICIDIQQDNHPLISHIVEVGGMQKAPLDTVTAS